MKRKSPPPAEDSSNRIVNSMGNLLEGGSDAGAGSSKSLVASEALTLIRSS